MNCARVALRKKHCGTLALFFGVVGLHAHAEPTPLTPPSPEQIQAVEFGTHVLQYFWGDLEAYVGSCLHVPKFCILNARETAILSAIRDALPLERSGAGLKFESGQGNPQRFELDGQGVRRSAVTGSTIGSPIYFNTDYWSHYDIANGKLKRLDMPQALRMLIHELGHHHGELDHQLLDRLGAKIAGFVLANGSFKTGVGDTEAFSFLFYRNHGWDNKSPEDYLRPRLIVQDATQVYDLSKDLAQAMPSPSNIPAPHAAWASTAKFDELAFSETPSLPISILMNFKGPDPGQGLYDPNKNTTVVYEQLIRIPYASGHLKISERNWQQLGIRNGFVDEFFSAGENARVVSISASQRTIDAFVEWKILGRFKMPMHEHDGDRKITQCAGQYKSVREMHRPYFPLPTQYIMDCRFKIVTLGASSEDLVDLELTLRIPKSLREQELELMGIQIFRFQTANPTNAYPQAQITVKIPARVEESTVKAQLTIDALPDSPASDPGARLNCPYSAKLLRALAAHLSIQNSGRPEQVWLRRQEIYAAGPEGAAPAMYRVESFWDKAIRKAYAPFGNINLYEFQALEYARDEPGNYEITMPLHLGENLNFGIKGVKEIRYEELLILFADSTWQVIPLEPQNICIRVLPEA